MVLLPLNISEKISTKQSTVARQMVYAKGV